MMEDFDLLKDLLEEEREYADKISKALVTALDALNAIKHVSQESNDAAYIIAKEALFQIEDQSQ